MQVLPGQITTLPVELIDELGAWLTAGHKSVLLPARYVGEELEEGNEVEVCLFHTDKGELQATRRMPHTPLGAVAFLTVKDVSNGAAFVSIGLPRDLIIPEREQVQPLELRDRSVVLVCYDGNSGTLFGTTRLLEFLPTKDIPLEKGEEVEALIFDKADFGWRAVINGKYCGIIKRDEIFHDVKRGKVFKAWVQTSEQGYLMVGLQREGADGLEDASRKIMAFLQNHKGYMRITVDTDPSEIKLRLRMSRTTFRRATEHLQRNGFVTITKRGVKLVKGEQTDSATEATA